MPDFRDSRDSQEVGTLAAARMMALSRVRTSVISQSLYRHPRAGGDLKRSITCRADNAMRAQVLPINPPNKVI
ncbi:hypothetical protein ACQ0MK_20965 [Thalassospira lucentensis]|uniref:hypothetical protein n=1 Tax=Thalassospira lucentensis TaxID=168935 RepID=UPI003D2EDEF1